MIVECAGSGEREGGNRGMFLRNTKRIEWTDVGINRSKIDLKVIDKMGRRVLQTSGSGVE